MLDLTPTLVLPARYTIDSQLMWRAAMEMGWKTERLFKWKLPATEIINPVIYVEALFAPMIAEQLNIVLEEPPVDWLSKLPFHYRNRWITNASLGTVVEAFLDSPLFIKPPNDKSFPAKVYDRPPENISLEQPVIVQDIVEFYSEFRCFMLNGRVLTSSLYMRDGKFQTEGATHQEFYNATLFAESVAADVDTPDAVVMDVGLMSNKNLFNEVDHRKWAVVELNAPWGSGIYNCSPEKALEVIRASMKRPPGYSPYAKPVEFCDLWEFLEKCKKIIAKVIVQYDPNINEVPNFLLTEKDGFVRITPPKKLREILCTNIHSSTFAFVNLKNGNIHDLSKAAISFGKPTEESYGNIFDETGGLEYVRYYGVSPLKRSPAELADLKRIFAT